MLKTGGHQLRLRHGGANPAGGIENLRESDMNHNSLIPGTSICVRLLESSKVITEVFNKINIHIT